MLNFCLKVKGGRIRGHDKTIFIQTWDSEIEAYEDELTFSNFGQAILALMIKGALTFDELMMLQDVASEAVNSITDIFMRTKNE